MQAVVTTRTVMVPVPQQQPQQPKMQPVIPAGGWQDRAAVARIGRRLGWIGRRLGWIGRRLEWIGRRLGRIGRLTPYPPQLTFYPPQTVAVDLARRHAGGDQRGVDLTECFTNKF